MADLFMEQYGEVVGGFEIKRDEDYKNGIKYLCESMSHLQVDPMTNISQIVSNPTLRGEYKEKLLGDILNESFNDPYFDTHITKIDQLFENTCDEMLLESASVGNLAPIVGTTLPILKKNYLDCNAKDIMITEVPTKPIVRTTFERKFLKDKAGKKYYIPEIFYDEQYKDVMSMSKGNPMPNKFFPEGDSTFLPIHEFNILGEAGGSIEKRDTLALNFSISEVQMDVDGSGTLVDVAVSGVIPDMGANNTFSSVVEYELQDGTIVKDILMGKVDFYMGTVSVSSSNGKIKKVKFGGNLSNENNVNTLEIDRERENRTWTIPDGERINTGLTVERIRDTKALIDVDLTAEMITDMSTVLTQSEDSSMLAHLSTSYDTWKTKKQLPFGYTGGFTEEAKFSCVPTVNLSIPVSQWINSELKFNLSRFIDRMKIKLKEQELMFVVSGHPNNITLLDGNVNWIIDPNTKVGGVEFNYSFGVLTDSKDRIHVVSSMKIKESEGLMVVAYPLTKETITFKHLKYSLNIENNYRNPNSPLIPNIMATSRHLTMELLPVQGRFRIEDNGFGIVQK